MSIADFNMTATEGLGGPMCFCNSIYKGMRLSMISSCVTFRHAKHASHCAQSPSEHRISVISSIQKRTAMSADLDINGPRDWGSILEMHASPPGTAANGHSWNMRIWDTRTQSARTATPQALSGLHNMKIRAWAKPSCTTVHFRKA